MSASTVAPASTTTLLSDRDLSLDRAENGDPSSPLISPSMTMLLPMTVFAMGFASFSFAMMLFRPRARLGVARHDARRQLDIHLDFA
jgi:hypothetical protein